MGHMVASQYTCTYKIPTQVQCKVYEKVFFPLTSVDHKVFHNIPLDNVL